MPGPFTPADTMIGPIVHAIATIIQQQIPSIAKVYEDLPDRAPIDNSVLLPLTNAKVKEETNGKMRVSFTIGARHVFKRKNMPDNVAQAYQYLMPWLQMLAAWPNQNLGLSYVRSVSATDARVTQLAESGQPMVALAVNFDVLAEFNIPLS